jgi:MFS family permease
LTLALGTFFFGAFLVLLPLIVRDVYHGGATDISLVFGANMLGTVLVIAFLMRRGGVVRQGRAFMVSLLFGCAVLTLLALGPPRWAFFVLSFVWGLGGAFTLTMGRTIVQELAPPELSARLLSVYALCTSAGMPIGSIAIGYAVQRFGPLDAAVLPAVGMAITVVLVGITSRFWHLEATTNAVR